MPIDPKDEYANVSDEDPAIQLINVASDWLSILGLEPEDSARCLAEIESVRSACASGFFQNRAIVINHLKAKGLWNG